MAVDGFNTISSTVAYGWDNLVNDYSGDYSELLMLTYNDVNYNESDWYFLPFVEAYSYEQIRDILNAYYNVMSNAKLVEAFKFSPYTPGRSDEMLLRNVALASSQNRDLCVKVLDRLYWNTMQGRIKTTQFLDPVSYQKTQNLKTTPSGVKSDWSITDPFFPSTPKGQEPGILGQAVELGQTVLVLLGAVAVIGGGYYIYQSVKGGNGN